MSNGEDMPLVSIGIPTFNRADSYFPQALESAQRQTYQNIEIIVSDNGSTDATKSVATASGDARVQYHVQDPALSPNDNFNYCLNASNGDFFLLLHDDDLIDPDFVELCMRASEGCLDVGIIRAGTRLVDGRGTTRKEKRNLAGGLPSEEFFLAWFLGETSLYLPSTLFNRRALQAIGGFKSRHNLFQDVAAEVTLAAQVGRIDIEEVKASFRVHDGERTFAVSVANWCEDAEDLLDLMIELAPERKSEVRTRGKAFFSELNYNRAAHIPHRVERYRTYLDIHRRFNSSLSPVTYFWLNPMKRKVVRRMKQVERVFARTFLGDVRSGRSPY